MGYRAALLAFILALAFASPAAGAVLQGEWESSVAIGDLTADPDWFCWTGLRLGGDFPLVEGLVLTYRLSAFFTSPGDEFTWAVERGYLEYETGPLRLRLGRQAVSWGAGWFFRPTDLITPRSPLGAEAARPGRDLFTMTWATSDVTAAEFVAGEDLMGMRAGWQLGRTSLRALALGDRDFTTLGLDFQGGIWGLYGEAAFEWTDGLGGGKPAVMVGWKRSFPNNLGFYLEYLHDERGRFHFGRDYLAAGLEIPRDELTNYTLAAVGNLDDGGVMLTGMVSLLLTDNLDLAAAAGIVLGSDGTEFLTLAGGSRASISVDLKYYF